MKIFARITLICCLAAVSCKSTKSVTASGGIPEIGAKKLIQNHYDVSFDEETLYAKLNVKYEGPKSGASLQVRLRMQRDKAIWISASKLGIPIAKLLISPERVQYYEKIKKTRFEGDFSLLSTWMGVELDFQKLQNILLGQAVFDLNKGRYSSKVADGAYGLEPKNGSNLFAVVYRLYPDHYKMQLQELRHKKKEQKLAVRYSDYQKIGEELFPKRLQIKATDQGNQTRIGIEYKSIELNRKLSFPFVFPKGYKEIKFN